MSDSLQQECDALQMASDSLSMGPEVLGLEGCEAPITMIFLQVQVIRLTWLCLFQVLQRWLAVCFLATGV